MLNAFNHAWWLPWTLWFTHSDGCGRARMERMNTPKGWRAVTRAPAPLKERDAHALATPRATDPTCLRATPWAQRAEPRATAPKHRSAGTHCKRWPSNPTTGFLTATTFIYALGAGITAAAGTRLALQWLSAVCIRYNPLRPATNGRRNTIFRRCLAWFALGNLRACCWP